MFSFDHLVAKGGRPEYRLALCQSFLYKFYLHVLASTLKRCDDDDAPIADLCEQQRAASRRSTNANDCW